MAKSQNLFNIDLFWAIFYETESMNWAEVNLATAKPRTKVIVQTIPNLRFLIFKRAHHRTFLRRTLPKTIALKVCR